MKITSLEEFHAYIMTGYKIGFENLKFFRASRKLECIQAYEGIVGEPIIGPSIHDVLRPANQQSIFFHFKTKEYDHIQHFSLLDANVIPNQYNDWYLFTTREEAEAYINPTKHIDTQLESLVYNAPQFKNNLRNLGRHKKIEAIKMLRSVINIDLGDAKTYIESFNP